MQAAGRWICARVAGDALDVGCGDDEIAQLVEHEAGRVVAVDPARAGALPFDDASFDTVLLGSFLAAWVTCERPIAEARRVLRPRGRLIVAVPYAGVRGEDGSAVSLEALLGELAEFTLKDVATVGEHLCLLAVRGRERSRAATWRRALGVAERRLAEREQAAAGLARSVAELEARCERDERSLADARADVVRLEAALAAATHRRDLEQEAARLAGDGVAVLERRLERLQRSGERELAEAGRQHERELAELGRDLAEARARLEAREEELERTRAAARDAQRELDARGRQHERDLAEARARLEAREDELERTRAAAREAQRELGARARKLAVAEARLENSQLRAERFQRSLVAIREGRSYRIMRVAWRLRRPFKRTPRDAAKRVAAEEDSDSAPAPVPTADLEPKRAPRRRVAPAERQSSQRPPGGPLRVASILDEMSTACFSPECELIPLTLEGWREQLDQHQPDLLLVESAWNANGGEWQYRIARYPRKDLCGLPALRALLAGCRERGIPTAFWNKEDPVHFDRFAEAASLFDHVFTTDARCVERYRILPGERTVASLPFAAQPRIHNPTAAVPERSASPCFAGAWYRDRHPERRRALEALLDAARPYGLVIYDRRFGGEDAVFGFPGRFQPHVLGTLPYERVLDVYKSHRVFLNANSVADSPTMCSRRICELAACDTAILSTPCTALSTLLGEGNVAEADDERAGVEALERLLGDATETARRTRAARRAVFAAHTYAERLATIAEAAGLDASSLRRQPFAVPNGAGDPGNGPGGDGYPWALLLQPGVVLAADALGDLRAAASFADADVIGTHPARDGDAAIEHRYAASVDPRALLVRRELLEARGRPTGSAEQVQVQLRKWGEDGVRIYAADADLLAAQDSPPVAVGSR